MGTAGGSAKHTYVIIVIIFRFRPYFLALLCCAMRATGLVERDVEGGGDCLFQSIATAEDPKRGSNAIAKRSMELRLLANDYLCPNGCPSEEEVDGLPISMAMEPLG